MNEIQIYLINSLLYLDLNSNTFDFQVMKVFNYFVKY